MLASGAATVAKPATEDADDLRTSRQDWASFDVEAADLRAFAAVCNWNRCAGFDSVIDGVDYSVIMRQYLWPLVSAAVRRLRGHAEFEDALTAQNLVLSRDRQPWTKRVAGKAQRSARWMRHVTARLSGQRHRPDVLIPFPRSTWNMTLSAVHAAKVATRTEPPFLWERFRHLRTAEVRHFAETLTNEIVSGLTEFSLDLAPHQLQALRNEVAKSHASVLCARDRLQRRPDLILTNTAATSPSIEYLLVARQLEIPTAAVQYGLDCDRYVYDDAHADNIAVWSEHRRRQYLKNSARQPQQILVTGNPEFHQAYQQDVSLPSGKLRRWLWVSSPHTPQRCKLPSSDPLAGVRMMRVLLEAVRRQEDAVLQIKPHPNDYGDLYRQMIRQANLQHRVSVTHQPVRDVAKTSELVITEDTTAGVECMLCGCILIHACPGEREPILSLTDYGAAEPGFSEDGLLDAIEKTAQGGRQDQRAGQTAFLQDFVGRNSDDSGTNIGSFVEQCAGVEGGVE